MKATVFFLSIFILAACTTSQPVSSNTNYSSNISPEAEAKTLTERMKTSLELDQNQTDRVMMINVVNLKLLKSFREQNQTENIAATKQKFNSEIKAVLSDTQYAKFLTEFNDL